MSMKFMTVLPMMIGLAGCMEDNTQRGIMGAAGGAVVAGAAGGNPVSGAVIGGAAGYFCKDLNIPGCR
jgi:osmotically inducible lipoprotein OsmB